MDEFRFQVNIGGIIDLLSQHLYSSPRVFIRELLQNAVDAVTARSLADASAPRIITAELIAGDRPQIRVSDSGKGLTLEEIHQFLSIIGESSKRGAENTDFIGRFGIGLLSGFLVSDKIVLETRSADSDNGYRWTGNQNGTYEIEPIEREEIGSTVILDASEAGRDYFEPVIIETLLRYYGDILPYPIFFLHSGKKMQINEMAPPWLTPAISDPQEIINYGEEYFGESFMGYIPLKSKKGEVDGVAYILDRRVVPNAKGTHRVYLRNMLLSEAGKGILPEWAFFLRAVVNANNLRPTASREDFYEDELLEATRNELGELIKEFLTHMAEVNPAFMERFIHEHSLALKALAIEEADILRTFADYFPFETSLGTYTLGEIRANGQLLRYTTKVDEFRQLSPVFGAMNQLLVNAGYVYDDELMTALAEEFPEWEMERVTPEDALFVMDSLDLDEKDFFFELEKAANSRLERWGIEVDVKKYRPDELPSILLINEEASFLADLRYSKENANDMFAELLDQFDKTSEAPRMVLCLNAANQLVKRLSANPEVDSSVYDLLYVQSVLLARRPLRREEMRALNSGILSLIERSI
jgi:molecular chaperone HtpG